MNQISNIKIVPVLSGWLLVLCCVVGCVSINAKATHGRAIPRDPAYGFHPTCWHFWPGCCGRGPGQAWTEATEDQPPVGEIVPTPLAEPNATGQEPAKYPPLAPQKSIETPPSSDLWP
jgi:hypothetical protein